MALSTPPFLDDLLHRTGPLQVLLLLLMSAAVLVVAVEIARRAAGRGPAPRDIGRPLPEFPAALVPGQRSGVDARSDR